MAESAARAARFAGSADGLPTVSAPPDARAASDARDRLVVGSPCQFWTDCLLAALRPHLTWEILAATGDSRRIQQVAVAVQARVVLLRLNDRERALYRHPRRADTVYPYSLLAIDEQPRPRPTTILQEGRFNWVPCHWQVRDLVAALAAWQRPGDRAQGATQAQSGAAASVPGHPWNQLTHRELQVCLLLAQGHSVRACAVQLGLQPSTVDNHKTHLMRKLGVHKTTELVRLAMRDRLLELP